MKNVLLVHGPLPVINYFVEFRLVIIIYACRPIRYPTGFPNPFGCLGTQGYIPKDPCLCKFKSMKKFLFSNR